MPTLLFPPAILPSQDICELLNSHLYYFKTYFQNFAKLWRLIENPLSESFNSQSKYFNFWARNVNWKYRFGFYHHQTSLHHSKSNFHFSERLKNKCSYTHINLIDVWCVQKLAKLFFSPFDKRKKSIGVPSRQHLSVDTSEQCLKYKNTDTNRNTNPDTNTHTNTDTKNTNPDKKKCWGAEPTTFISRHIWTKATLQPMSQKNAISDGIGWMQVQVQMTIQMKLQIQIMIQK